MSMKNFLTIFAVALLVASCSCGGGFRHGQEVTVSQRCIWASNEDTFEQMTKCCNRRDERGLELMEGRGEVGILWTGDKGIVTDLAFGKVRIRLENDQEVWVASEFLR